MKCSLVIRAYNESLHLGRLLEGITHQSVKDVEIILVDSGSTDSTVSIANAYGATIVHIPPEEFTFARSLNLGIQPASRELIVIASAHVYPVYPNWLESLLFPFEDDQVALVYGKQRGGQESRFSEHQIFQQWFPEADVARQMNSFCNNANAAIRHSLWARHAYDETLTGLEDIAWAAWAQGQGFAISYSAEAEIIHVHEETPGAVYNRYRREAMAFKRIFPEAHFNIYDFFRLTASNLLNDLDQALRRHRLAGNLVSIFWFRIVQFWGTYQGYRHSSEVTPNLRQTFYYPPGAVTNRKGESDIEPIRYNPR